MIRLSTPPRPARPAPGPALGAAAALLLLAGCADPYANLGAPGSQQRQGAILGAAAGALAGAASDDDNRFERAAVGAAIGATAGGVIGNRLDQQEAALRARLDPRVGIVNTGDRLVVNLPQDILFETDSAALRPDLRADLQAVAANLNQFPGSTVQVVGHADNTGAAAYNQDLSERRARAVAGALAQGGVDPGRVGALGRGEDQPIASNLTPEGRALNRRVEIVIIPTV